MVVTIFLILELVAILALSMGFIGHSNVGISVVVCVIGWCLLWCLLSCLWNLEINLNGLWTLGIIMMCYGMTRYVRITLCCDSRIVGVDSQLWAANTCVVCVIVDCVSCCLCGVFEGSWDLQVHDDFRLGWAYGLRGPASPWLSLARSYSWIMMPASLRLFPKELWLWIDIRIILFALCCCLPGNCGC